jgi:hypothetical protein
VLARGGEGELARRPKKPVLAGAGAGCTAGAGSLWPKRPMVVVDVEVREGMGSWGYGELGLWEGKIESGKLMIEIQDDLICSGK